MYSTREVYDGKEVMENASFRTYSDMKESFIDYAKFLAIENPRYREAFQYAKDINPRPSYYPKDYSPENANPKRFLEAIIGAGYATDPIYVDKVASVWETNQIEVA
jgi:flagellum-specific peptidoglycan hydrolase FlgJ